MHEPDIAIQAREDAGRGRGGHGQLRDGGRDRDDRPQHPRARHPGLARAEARTELAAESSDAQIADLEISQVEDEAERKYEEYQRQLGILPPEPAEKTMEPVAAEEEEEKPVEPEQLEEQTQ